MLLTIFTNHVGIVAVFAFLVLTIDPKSSFSQRNRERTPTLAGIHCAERDCCCNQPITPPILRCPDCLCKGIFGTTAGWPNTGRERPTIAFVWQLWK